MKRCCISPKQMDSDDNDGGLAKVAGEDTMATSVYVAIETSTEKKTTRIHLDSLNDSPSMKIKKTENEPKFGSGESDSGQPKYATFTRSAPSEETLNEMSSMEKPLSQHTGLISSAAAEILAGKVMDGTTPARLKPEKPEEESQKRSFRLLDDQSYGEVKKENRNINLRSSNKREQRFFDQDMTESLEMRMEESLEEADFRALERGGSRSSERNMTRTLEKSSLRSSDRGVSRPIERGGNRASDRALTRTIERSGNRSSDRTKSIEKTGNRNNDKGMNRSMEKSGTRTKDRMMNRSMEKSGDMESSMTSSQKRSRMAGGLDPAVEELRQYYESEIALLRRQVQGIYGERPSEEALLKRCHHLEGQIRNSNNEVESLKEQVFGLKTQLEAWPSRVEQVEDEKETMRARLEEVRTINQHKEGELEHARERIQSLEVKLWEHTSAPRHDQMLLQRMMEEYDQLVKDYDLVKAALAATEHKLFNARSQLAEQTRKIAQLELDIQKSENEANYLRRRSLAERNGPPSSQPWYVHSMDRENKCNDDHMESTHRRLFPKEETGFRLADKRADPGLSLMSMSCYGALPSSMLSHQVTEMTACHDPDHESQKDRDRQRNRERQKELERQRDMEMQRELERQRDQEKQQREMEMQRDIERQREHSIERQSRDTARMEQPTRNFGRKKSTLTASQQGNSLMTSSLYENSPMTFKSAPCVRDQTRSPPVKEVRSPLASSVCLMSTSELLHQHRLGNWSPGDAKTLERRYDELQMEKRNLETQLSHLPSSFGTTRNKRVLRDQRDNIEAKLDHVQHDVGALRMALRQINVLK